MIEVLNNKASLKNMGTGEETVVELSCDSIYNIIKNDIILFIIYFKEKDKWNLKHCLI